MDINTQVLVGRHPEGSPGTCRENDLQTSSILSTDGLSFPLKHSIEYLSNLGTKFETHYKKLYPLQTCFVNGQFHLAVLRQFKRRKSTLLNALPGGTVSLRFSLALLLILVAGFLWLRLISRALREQRTD